MIINFLEYSSSVFVRNQFLSRFSASFSRFSAQVDSFSALFLSFFGTIYPLFKVIVKAGSSRRAVKTMIINPLENTLYSFTVLQLFYFYITIPRCVNTKKILATI